ncbi:MAG: hypothetical protein ACI9OJ_003791, partial [Myxococcota bacterium]
MKTPTPPEDKTLDGRPTPRRPLGVMICVAALFVTMAFPAPPLVDPTGAALPEVTLDLPTAYV